MCDSHVWRMLVQNHAQKNTAGVDPGFFFRRGCTCLLPYLNTNKPHSFFVQNTSCIRKPQVISGGREGGVHPLHPPPRSAPEQFHFPELQYHHKALLLNDIKCLPLFSWSKYYIITQLEYSPNQIQQRECATYSH